MIRSLRNLETSALNALREQALADRELVAVTLALAALWEAAA